MFHVMPQDQRGWVNILSAVRIPVLRTTIEELSRMRENEDRLLARDISRVLLHDPMFTLRLLCFLSTVRKNRQPTEVTTVEHALMMIGVTPFFHHFRDLPSVESTLVGHPQALQGVMRVLNRAHHAAMYANDWARVRNDVGADEIVAAALLHDLAEMLLWCFAPELALRIQRMLQSDASLRSSAAQRAVLGITFNDLQIALASNWELPELLQSLMADTQARRPRTINVLLAIDLARHSANGWDDPALPDDYAAISRFLALPVEEVMQRIHRVARQAKGGAVWYGMADASEATPPLG